jgi:hypothetical protein
MVAAICGIEKCETWTPHCKSGSRRLNSQFHKTRNDRTEST